MLTHHHNHRQQVAYTQESTPKMMAKLKPLNSSNKLQSN